MDCPPPPAVGSRTTFVGPCSIDNGCCIWPLFAWYRARCSSQRGPAGSSASGLVRSSVERINAPAPSHLDHADISRKLCISRNITSLTLLLASTSIPRMARRSWGIPRGHMCHERVALHFIRITLPYLPNGAFCGRENLEFFSATTPNPPCPALRHVEEYDTSVSLCLKRFSTVS